MSPPPLILLVDDDPHIRDVLRFALDKAGFRTAEAADGQEALAQFQALRPDLLVLDIMMPQLDGTEVCRRVRAQARTPIIFLSSRDEDVDRIIGLELGGDDYIGKPFSPRELVARVRAVLRRAAPGEPNASPSGASPSGASVPGGSPSGASVPGGSPPGATPREIVRGPLRLDLDAFRAFWGGQEIVFTVTELGILRTLMGYPGKVFTRDELMDGAYDEPNVVSDRTIDSHVRRVRQKLARAGADPIQTVFGVGYKLVIA